MEELFFCFSPSLWRSIQRVRHRVCWSSAWGRSRWEPCWTRGSSWSGSSSAGWGPYNMLFIIIIKVVYWTRGSSWSGSSYAGWGPYNVCFIIIIIVVCWTRGSRWSGSSSAGCGPYRDCFIIIIITVVFWSTGTEVVDQGLLLQVRGLKLFVLHLVVHSRTKLYIWVHFTSSLAYRI